MYSSRLEGPARDSQRGGMCKANSDPVRIVLLMLETKHGVDLFSGISLLVVFVCATQLYLEVHSSFEVCSLCLEMLTSPSVRYRLFVGIL